MHMPRKRSNDMLTKVVSSIISLEDFEMLEKYARVNYTQNLVKCTDYFTHCTLYFEQVGKPSERERTTGHP